MYTAEPPVQFGIAVDVYRRFHRGAFRLFLHFKINSELKRLVRDELNGRWSQTHKAWYVDDTPEMKNRIIAVCKGRAWYNLREINKYLDVEAEALVVSGETQPKSTVEPSISLGVNEQDYQRYIQYLKALGKSHSTINTYGGMVRRLAEYYNKQLIRRLTPEMLYAYISKEVVDKNRSNSYHRQLIGALKHFFRDRKEELELDIVADLTYPDKHKQLPKVISEEDVIRILRATRNLKHRLAFAMLYSCGLRISELLNLKLKEIDVERRTVYVRKSKGNKDRVVMLAQSVIPLLSNYIEAYHPVEYLLNGQSGLKYSATSVRKSLHNARKEAGVERTVTPHTLRHSFATHLLEQGVGIRYIQELLGHSKPETTMIYTYVANDRLSQVSSPLDHIVSKITQHPNDHLELPKSGF